jgi:hypothetical protein
MSLFAHAQRLFRDAARREFRATEAGRLLSQVERMTRSGAGLRDIERRFGAALRGGSLGDALRGTETGRFVADVAKYGARDGLFRSLMEALGPLGDVMSALLRPGGSRMAAQGRELSAAANLLRAFGYNVTPPAGAGRVPTSDPSVASSRKFLESLGFTVAPPKPSAAPGRLHGATEPAPAAAPEATRRGLPGWKTVGGRQRRYDPSDPILTGEMVEVESSNVHSIGFLWNDADPMKGTLKIRFLQAKRGNAKIKVPGPLYFYSGVHPDVFTAFRAAASKGTFVWDRIRIRGTVSGHRYHYELKGIAQGYVPRKATRYGKNEYFIGREVRARAADGTITTRRSEEPDAFVGRYSPVNRGIPERGLPDRGERPGRGR